MGLPAEIQAPRVVPRADAGEAENSARSIRFETGAVKVCDNFILYAIFILKFLLRDERPRGD